MNLQDTFYWMAIIYMATMFVIMVAGLIAVLAIKKKIDTIHESIEEKIQKITSIARTGGELFSKAKSTFKKDA